MNEEVPLNELLKKKKISQKTYDKVLIAKQYIERKYNLKVIKNLEWNEIISKINSLNVTEEEKNLIKNNVYAQETLKYRKSRAKQTIHDYESIKIIGRGAFGEVHVCRNKITDEIVAVKKIKKEVLDNKNQVIHIKNEQLFMSKVKSPWIVELKASFQDYDYLYLVMEYLQGGDLMNILIKKDILTEEEARFYVAEIVLAIESIHKLDCIHRDIKPDNVLIDKSGHIKLTDFGLSKISDKIFQNNFEKNLNLNNNKTKDNGKPTHNKNYSCVGTAYYVAPEVLNKRGYGPEVDWWSLGVIFFEMLVGYVPFCSKETNEACYKVLNWKKYLKIPDSARMSREAEDLIFKLINSPKKRLGANGAEEIKSHPFFYGFNWDNILNIKPPFIPFLRSEYDTSYFDVFEKVESFYPHYNIRNKFKRRKNMEYLDYSFKNDSLNDLSLNEEYLKAVKAVEQLKIKSKKNNSYEKTKKQVKIYKKRSNGANTFGLLKLYSTSQNDNNSVCNTKNNNSLKDNVMLKTSSNNSSISKVNKIINISSKRNSISNCSYSGISKNKVNIIKIGQKKSIKINNIKNRSLNRIKIPLGVNHSLKKITKSKKSICPLYIYLKSNKNKKKVSMNKIKLPNIINHCKSYCGKKNNKNEINLKYNLSHMNIFGTNANKNNVGQNDKNNKLFVLNNINSVNNNATHVLYSKYNKDQKNCNTQMDNSYNSINTIKIKNKSFRLYLNSKNPEFFFKKNIPLKKQKNIKLSINKSPNSYMKVHKSTYYNGAYNISKNIKNKMEYINSSFDNKREI